MVENADARRAEDWMVRGSRRVALAGMWRKFGELDVRWMSVERRLTSRMYRVGPDERVGGHTDPTFF